MTGLALDIRLALRRLWSRPLVSLLAIATVAVGIGATTAIFSVVRSVLLNPLPFPDSSRLVRVTAEKPAQEISGSGINLADFEDLREGVDSLEDVGVWSWNGLDYGRERPRSLATIRVSIGFLDLLGVRPALGRWFREGEDRPGEDRVVILSWGFWQDELGADPAVVDRDIVLDGEPWTVVGVMPESFAFPVPGEMVWIPWTRDPANPPSRQWRWVQSVARLAPGATLDSARAEVRAFASGLEEAHPETNGGWSLALVPLLDDTVDGVGPSLWSLQAGGLVLLLIACANVASLSLMRGLARRGELAVRTALGAGRRGVARLLFVETLLSTGLGAVLGLLLAAWGVDALVAAGPQSLPRVQEVAVDRPVLSIALFLSLVVGFGVGLLPVVQAWRADVPAGLKAGGRGDTGTRSTARLRRVLVVAELGLSVFLVVGAGLVSRSFVETLRTDLGFDPDGLVAVQLFSWDRGYEEPERRLAFFDALTERLRGLPGVRSVGRTSNLPFSVLSAGSSPVQVDGRAEEEAIQARTRVATASWFPTMGIPLVAGRSFEPTDGPDTTPVVLINRAAVEAWFPDGNAVGRRLGVGGAEAEAVVVGVVGDFRDSSIEANPVPELFVPHSQNRTGTISIVMRTDGDPESLLQRVRETVWDLDSGQSIFAVVPMADLLRGATERRRFLTGLSVLLAMIALFLSVVGLFGVVAYSVRSRRREWGIRVSVGAGRRDIVRLVLGEGLRLVAIGTLFGAFAAGVTGHWIESLLYRVSPGDPVVWTVSLAVLLVTGGLACAWPAARAGAVDPVRALRDD